MNMPKLVEYATKNNIHPARIVAQVSNARTVATERGNIAALLATIHAEIEPQLEAMRLADDLLERCTRTSNGIDSQGYSCLVGDKYSGHVYTVGTMESDLARANDSFHGVYAESSVNAANDTRSKAGNISAEIE